MTSAEQRIVGLKRQLRRAQHKHALLSRSLVMVTAARDRFRNDLQVLKAPKGPQEALREPDAEYNQSRLHGRWNDALQPLGVQRRP